MNLSPTNIAEIEKMRNSGLSWGQIVTALKKRGYKTSRGYPLSAERITSYYKLYRKIGKATPSKVNSEMRMIKAHEINSLKMAEFAWSLLSSENKINVIASLISSK